MILKVHVHGAPSYDVGDEIWQQSLADAIREEAEVIANHAGPELLALTEQELRSVLRGRIIAAMTEALVDVGDSYRAPDGVHYSLIDSAVKDTDTRDKLELVSAPEPVIEEVLQFEDLPVGTSGTRRAVVRWSDGRETEALRWFGDEILICEGDLLGKTRAELRSLHFLRDRDWLQS
jgi:hypothetical protein